ncbi:hypothetical protein TRFO_09977 [Tritrichomonas foetus]|uniref:Uncharacterized protein n=1 Tax=Tritrichomonas foetus TaxID=1144522 RepID=A0A1J4JDH4_9EUKA|nr:hypothetical protein TRFO_09977 [Tritrichomonas foetus]|eukprot:OHS96335.1 hypothetical protein TRFO_09977 [Tritrichomonas foetus]
MYAFTSDSELAKYIELNDFDTIILYIISDDPKNLVISLKTLFHSEETQNVRINPFFTFASMILEIDGDDNFPNRGLTIYQTNVHIKMLTPIATFSCNSFYLSNVNFDFIFEDDPEVANSHYLDTNSENNFTSSNNHHETKTQPKIQYLTFVVQNFNVKNTNFYPINGYLTIKSVDFSVDLTTIYLSAFTNFESNPEVANEISSGKIYLVNFISSNLDEEIFFFFESDYIIISYRYSFAVFKGCLNYPIQIDIAYGTFYFEGEPGSQHAITFAYIFNSYLEIMIYNNFVYFEEIMASNCIINMTTDTAINNLKIKGDNNFIIAYVNMEITKVFECLLGYCLIVSMKTNLLFYVQKLLLGEATLAYEGGSMQFKVYEIVLTDIFTDGSETAAFIEFPVILMKRLKISTVKLYLKELRLLSNDVCIGVGIYMDSIGEEYRYTHPIVVENLICDGFTFTYFYYYNYKYDGYAYTEITRKYLNYPVDLLILQNDKLLNLQNKIFYNTKVFDDYSVSAFDLEESSKISFSIQALPFKDVNDTNLENISDHTMFSKMTTWIAKTSSIKKHHVCISDNSKYCPESSHFYDFDHANSWQQFIGHDTKELKIFIDNSSMTLNVPYNFSQFNISYIIESKTLCSLYLNIDENITDMFLRQLKMNKILLKFPTVTPTFFVENVSIYEVCNYYNAESSIFQNLKHLYIDHRDAIICSPIVQKNKGVTYLTKVESIISYHFMNEGIQCILPLSDDTNINIFTKSHKKGHVSYHDESNHSCILVNITEIDNYKENYNNSDDPSTDWKNLELTQIPLHDIPNNDRQNTIGNSIHFDKSICKNANTRIALPNYFINFFEYLQENEVFAIEWPVNASKGVINSLSSSVKNNYIKNLHLKILPLSHDLIEIKTDLPDNVYIELDRDHKEAHLRPKISKIPIRFNLSENESYKLYINSNDPKCSTFYIDTNLSISKTSNFSIYTEGNTSQIDFIRPFQIRGGTIIGTPKQKVSLHNISVFDGGLDLAEIKGVIIKGRIIMTPGSFLQVEDSSYSNTEIYYFINTHMYPSKIYSNSSNLPKAIVIHHFGSDIPPPDSRKWVIISKNPLFCVDINSEIDIGQINIDILTPIFKTGDQSYSVSTNIEIYQNKRCIVLIRNEKNGLNNASIIGIACGAVFLIIIGIYIYRNWFVLSIY